MARPTLVVVDYAAASVKCCASGSRRWRAARRGSGAPLRVLLLERHAERDSGWWQDLISGGGYSGPGGDSLIDAGAPLRLVRCARSSIGGRCWRRRCGSRRRLLGRTPPPLPPPGADTCSTETGAITIETEPLFLHDGRHRRGGTGAPAALAMGRLDLARYVGRTNAAGWNIWRRRRGGQDVLVCTCCLRHLAERLRSRGGDRAGGGGTPRLGDRRSRTDQLVALLHDALARRKETAWTRCGRT